MSPTMYKLRWHGDEIIAASEAAMKAGIDETMGRCVEMAKSLVRVDTTTLQGSIRFTPTKVSGKGAEGSWGSYDVNYAIYQELGTYKMPAKPYLRPAADFNYGQLAARIRRRMGTGI